MEEDEIKCKSEKEKDKQELNKINEEEKHNIDEINENIIIETNEKYPEIKINQQQPELNRNINIINNIKEDNTNNEIIINSHIKKENEIKEEYDESSENLSLINIDKEKEKNKKNNKDQNNNKEEIEEELEKEEENINIINIGNYEEEEKQENLNINDYLFTENEDNLKYIKEYTDKDDDLHSKRLTARDNNNDYLIKEKEKDEEKNNEIDIDVEQGDDEDDLIPFKIVGDTKKKGDFLGAYNYRYLELDSVKGVLKRYLSTKEYPKHPKEIIDLRNFKLIKKQKLIKGFYDLEITYTNTSSKGKKTEKVENYRFIHQECRNKWFDSILNIWKSLIKGNQIQTTKNNLCFIDDRLGLIQNIGRGNKHGKKKRPKIDLKKFKIISLLGVGGFGTVFKVRHILTDKIYAMKVMNKNYIIKKKYLHYVVSEFEIMKSLSGFPFILDIHYCFQTANYLYLIIDYCPNGDFAKLESINNPRLFLAELILAFEYIHNKGIIYRDLKPENILLDSTGHIKLCDFNLAKAGMTKNKRADSFCGSPLYFSPEMVSNKGANYKCDIYGIGLLMYEIIVGEMAYKAFNIKELYEKIKRNDINFNHHKLKGDAKDLVLKLCAKEPEDRIELEEVKKHKYFKGIDFNKVLNKEYGKIQTVKQDKNKKKENIDINTNIKDKEYLEHKKFLSQQKLLDEDTSSDITKGKISLKEMMLDQTRHMKNRVRQFYYVKKEDIEKTEEFKLETNGNMDISSLIMDQYDA